MLVISRRKGQRVSIGEEIELVVTEVRRFRSDQGLRPGQRVGTRLLGLDRTGLAPYESLIRSLARLDEPADGFVATATLSVAGGVAVELDTRGTIDVAAAIIFESTLSFLGLGFPSDVPTWGSMLRDAKDYLDIAAHWALFPGGAIFLTVLAINFIGDGLRDTLDPRRVL